MRIWNLLIVGGTATALAACTHPGTALSASGDVTVDSLSASRTAILRVDNAYPAEVRVYTVLGGQSNYVAKAKPSEVRTWILDPNLFPTDNMSFEIRPADGTAPRRLGPFKIYKGQTIELVVPADFDNTRIAIHRSTQ